ncbi:mitochondrial carrier protein, putative [Plasmodium vivax]|uniref:Mitochondrial carrier protein, putative n=6 Tax=Plasmodium vivax TaxID=5855 RepID=A5K8R9_PLAVS|nr:mitochondrial carrier protein, putative [Plasmodium vivax]KMZ77500.1 mitochondrial carrier protein [Plasmodium vivax India VII]KMZ84662.1 mitochondrial carrier protein [Plasmodium vivax Brazil I]KMZ89940.1 mitochondrial carrier protein [Plasmodium vivax Mauritania I]KMZ96660.1 mitochondrial carrier protein [Plasmodium vivax North Korean]EDL44215.1 mitochondrial carrier protein, putative [Plasmodium vivax]|eukprot:XP_001613942.1 mitochondrial carrier protein [Plasmodium vivax Sal-1]
MEHFHNLVTGALSGVAVDAVLYPIDSLKTNMQAKKALSFSDIKKMYSGIFPTLVGTIPASAFFYCFYELSKKLLKEKRENISKTNLYLISTSMAEVAASVVRMPFEIVKQKMQVSGSSSVINTIYEITQREGLLSFLGKSYFVIIVREIPFDCIQYFLWETLKEKAKRDFGKFSKKYPSITSAICGGLAGGIAGFLTTPMDVIKSRQIIYGKSYIETVTEIAEEGYLTFYKGCCFRSIYLFFGGLIFFGSLRFFSFKKE